MTDQHSDHRAIIDSVMDINYAAGRITYDHADHVNTPPRHRQCGLCGRYAIMPDGGSARFDFAGLYGTDG